MTLKFVFTLALASLLAMCCEAAKQPPKAPGGWKPGEDIKTVQTSQGQKDFEKERVSVDNKRPGYEDVFIKGEDDKWKKKKESEIFPDGSKKTIDEFSDTKRKFAKEEVIRIPGENKAKCGVKTPPKRPLGRK